MKSSRALVQATVGVGRLKCISLLHEPMTNKNASFSTFHVIGLSSRPASMGLQGLWRFNGSAEKLKELKVCICTYAGY